MRQRRPGLKHRLAGVVTLFLVAVACGAASAPDEADVTLAFETLLEGAHSGLDEPLREVVRDGARWAALWGEIHSRVRPAPRLPTVDFSRHMVLVVGLGTRRSAGFQVEVRSVTLQGGRLLVAVHETCPDGGAVGMALTQPVHAVRVDRLAQDAAFRETRAASCD